MKFSASIFALSCLFAATDAASANLRSASLKDESICNSQHDKDTCYASTDEDTQQSCQWCECQAIPSECLSPDQAAQVPQGICQCSSPSFSFSLEGVTLEAHALDSEVCDKKGKSGYFSVKGSQYDENGEDKNLFFWMFEKRTVEENEVVPFIVWLTGGPGCSSSLVSSMSC
jgi:hypothetical protein